MENERCNTDVENLQILIEDLTEENFDDTVKTVLNMDVEPVIEDCVYFLFHIQKENMDMTHVYAGLVTILNAKWPQLGEKLVGILMRDFKDGTLNEIYDKCATSACFLTHLGVQEVIPESTVDEIFEYLLIMPSGFTIRTCFKLYHQQFGYFFWTQKRLRKKLRDANDAVRSGEIMLDHDELKTLYEFQSDVDYTIEEKLIYKEPGLKRKDYSLEMGKITHQIGFLGPKNEKTREAKMAESEAEEEPATVAPGTSDASAENEGGEADFENLQTLIEALNEDNFNKTVKTLLDMDLEPAIEDCVYILFDIQKENMDITHVYAGLATILNAKWPQLGKNLAMILIRDFKDGTLHEVYDKCATSACFLTHLSVQEVIPEDAIDETFEYLLRVPSGFTIRTCFQLYHEHFGYFFWTQHRLRKMLRDVNDGIRSGEVVLSGHELDTLDKFQSDVNYTMEKHKLIYKKPGLKVKNYSLEMEKITHDIGFQD